MPLGRAAKNLVEFVRGKVGDGLRGVVSYTPDHADLVYIRSDLEEQVNLDDFEPTIHQARELHDQLVAVGRFQGRTLGSPLGNVSVFEHSIVLVFMYDEDSGVIATLDREVGRQLASFVEDCSAVLRSED